MMTRMGGRHKALVAGASGVVGRNLIEHLCTRGDWEVVGVSRRSPDEPVTWQHLAIDLEDKADCRAKMTAHTDVTHVFYAARAPRVDPFEEARVNRDMLANLVSAEESTDAALEDVHLVHGTKWYGCQMGPFPTPSREVGPRQFRPTLLL